MSLPQQQIEKKTMSTIDHQPPELIEWDGTTLTTHQVATVADTQGAPIVVERSTFIDADGKTDVSVDLALGGCDLVNIAPAEAFKLGTALTRAALDLLAKEAQQ